MPLTPAEIDSMEFRRPVTGTRGYHEDEVDQFLDGVADEMRRLETENRALHDRLTHADLADHADLAERVRRAELDCLVAQERARAVEAELEQARAAAHERARTPERPADPRMMELAQRTADDHLADARREAETLMEQAGTKAAHLLSDAQLRASTIVADARHAHAETIAGLTAKRAAALAEIGELAEAARRRREAIAADVAGRLSDLTGGA